MKNYFCPNCKDTREEGILIKRVCIVCKGNPVKYFKNKCGDRPLTPHPSPLVERELTLFLTGEDVFNQ